MLAPGPVARLFLHFADLAVIAFPLLPIAAVTLGALQAEKPCRRTRELFCRQNGRSTISG